jgi:hypothetical protein
MVSVSYVLNKYIAPFCMGFSTAAFAVSNDAVSVLICFVIVGVCGVFSLPNSNRMIKRFFDAIV